MTNLDHDPLIGAFDAFRDQAGPFVKPLGADRTRQGVHNRRRNRTAAGALFALVAAVPLAAGLVVTGKSHDSPAVVPRVTASTSYFVGPGETTRPSATAPNGGISEKTLYSAELDLPAWPPGPEIGKCGAGLVRFENGDTVVNDRNLWIAGVSYADVDGDGRAETFARVFCVAGLDVVSQVVAFTPDAGHKIRTLGAVARQTGDIVAICAVRAGPDGKVQVQTVNFPVPWRCADPASAEARYYTRHWLTFIWTGSAFAQQGTTASPINAYATDLELTSTDLVLTRQANGHYTGSMTLTVHNAGASAIPYKTQTVIPDGMRLVDPPPGCAVDQASKAAGMEDVFCSGAELAAGATRHVTLRVDSPRSYVIDFIPDTNVLPLDGYADSNEANDRAALTVRFRG